MLLINIDNYNYINININRWLWYWIVRYDMIVIIEYSLFAILGWIKGMFNEWYYNNISGEYCIYYSMLCLVVCELLLFVCLFWYIFHDIEHIYEGDNSTGIQFISTSVGSNWLLCAFAYSITVDTDDDVNDEDELYEWIVNIHSSHLTLAGLAYIRYYWWFVDTVWLIICTLFYY